MWTPSEVMERIANESLLPDSMFEEVDADAALDDRDDDFDDDWVRAAEAVEAAWEAARALRTQSRRIDRVKEKAFKRVFSASGGHHDLAAAVSDDFELICKRALTNFDCPFIAVLEQAYEAKRFPH
jgi:hypothetical protein